MTESSGGVKCGHREIVGDFAAPEQLWPFPDNEDFDDSLMPPYDEMVDVWKIPDVCSHFLTDYKQMLFRLFPIHNKCKEYDPGSRPKAEEVLREYQRILRDIEL